MRQNRSSISLITPAVDLDQRDLSRLEYSLNKIVDETYKFHGFKDKLKFRITKEDKFRSINITLTYHPPMENMPPTYQVHPWVAKLLDTIPTKGDI
jgi:hypothetical protein